jgi:hypothetical protein
MTQYQLLPIFATNIPIYHVFYVVDKIIPLYFINIGETPFDIFKIYIMIEYGVKKY